MPIIWTSITLRHSTMSMVLRREILPFGSLQILTKELPSHQFIGHIGGDDFVVLLNNPSSMHKVIQALERFEKEILSFYTNEHRMRGVFAQKTEMEIWRSFLL